MSTEKKYINVDEAFEVITDFAGRAETKSAYGAYWKAAKAIKKLTSVIIPPVREGKWRFCGSDRWNDAYECSVCGKMAMDNSNYCPNCGAKMLNK